MILPAHDGIDVALDALARGDVIALPTDTVYGVAVSPLVPGATARLFAAKQRPPDVALAVLLADPSDLDEVAAGLSPAAERLASRWWPGPLTLVVARHPSWLGVDLGGDAATIGVRCPDATVARELARRAGPIATTSANMHGRPTPPDAPGVAAELGGAVAVVLDGGRCEGAPSTVVDVTGGDVRVLREGRVPAADVRGTI